MLGERERGEIVSQVTKGDLLFHRMLHLTLVQVKKNIIQFL